MGMKTKTAAGWIAAFLLAAGAARAQDAGFYRDLFRKARADFADGVRTMLTLKEGKDPGALPYAELHARGKKAGLFQKDWNFKASSPLTKGQVSYMVVKALGIEGGLTMRLFGPSQRYAIRECEHLGIIKPGETESARYVSGGELMAILTRANNYKKEGTVNVLRKKPSGSPEPPRRRKPETPAAPAKESKGDKKDK
jgi:hypothetical protein